MTVVLDIGTGAATLEVDPGWRDHVDLRRLEFGIVAAFAAALASRVTAWATTPARRALRPRRGTPAPPAPTATTPTPATRTAGAAPPIGVPENTSARVTTSARPVIAESPGSGTPDPARTPDTGDTGDALVAAVTQARRRFAASTPAMFRSWTTPTTLTSSCHRVQVTIRAGRLIAVRLDQTWAAHADDTTLTAAVQDALSAALRALTRSAHPAPTVTADLDTVVHRALTLSRAGAHTAPARHGSAHTPTAPPPPDPDDWPDQVARVLTAVGDDTTPWRVTAADHLRQTADILDAQSPTRSAFSFGGTGVATSYEAVHRQTLTLLRDAARSYTDAAGHTETGRDEHTALHDTADPTGTAPADDAEPEPEPGPGPGPEPGPGPGPGTPPATMQVSPPAAPEPGSPAAPAKLMTPAVHELADTARTGLDACLLYLETVHAGIDTVLGQLPTRAPLVIHDDLAELRRHVDETRRELDGVFSAVGDPDALHAGAQTWIGLFDEQACTLTGIVTPATDPGGASRITATDTGGDADVDVFAAQAAAAAVLRCIGTTVQTNLAALSDALTIFWITLTAATCAAEAQLAVAAVLAGSPLTAPAALVVAVTATRQLRGLATVSGLLLVMADSDAAASLSALRRQLLTHTAVRHPA